MSAARAPLYASGRILIQRAGQVAPGGLATFKILPIADPVRKVGLVSACEVEFSSTAASTGAVARFDVRNLHPNTVREMADAGFVRIEAGYLNHPTRPVQTIFFGRLNRPKWTGGGRLIRWSFTATAFPAEIWAVKPNTALPIAQDGQPVKILAGEAIRVIADRIGIGRANVLLPKVFDGDLSETELPPTAAQPSKATESFRNAVTLEQWTTTRTAIEELQDLLLLVSNAIRSTFGVVRNYSLLPDVNNPFRVVVEDVTRFSGEYLPIDLDSPNIIDYAPDDVSVPTQRTDEEAEEAEEVIAATGSDAVPNKTIEVTGFKVVSAFDPKVSMGILVRSRSALLGIQADFKVLKGKHTLSGSPLRWRTEFGGQRKLDAEVNRGS